MNSDKKKKTKTSIFRKLVLMSVMFTAFPVIIVGVLVTFSYQQVITEYLSSHEKEELRQAGEEIFVILQSVSTQAFLILLIVIILSLFGSIIMARSLARPVKKILTGVERVGKGDFNFKVSTKSNDEIGELSERFNEMIGKLKKQSALEDSKNVLEVKVKAKTRELEELNRDLEYKVRERTRDLRRKIKDLEKFRTVTVGRELKMIELKKENKKLKEEVQMLQKEKDNFNKKKENINPS